jgi:hypothetical protein
MSEELELTRRDEANGIRLRRFNAKFDALAKRHGVDPDAARAFAASSVTDACRTDLDRKAVADSLGIDWEGLTEFMEALAPIILEFMAACA